MRVLVCGGRHYTDRGFVYLVLDTLRGVECVITGCAPGADQLACDWANERGVEHLSFPANWSEYGKAAGPIRNASMLQAKPDVVIAFEGGSGTRDMVQRAEKAGIQIMYAGMSA